MGHDFRADYLRIRRATPQPERPLAAFTATADAETAEETSKSYSMAKPPQLPAALIALISTSRSSPRLSRAPDPRCCLCAQKPIGHRVLRHARGKPKPWAQALRERRPTTRSPITAGWNPRRARVGPAFARGRPDRWSPQSPLSDGRRQADIAGSPMRSAQKQRGIITRNWPCRAAMARPPRR